ncbi:hypothetical protein RchiOBHm_Chr6g0244961 [Rosa chinensis]|uniref:Uncharacterized protein n=1 Tax=Rosa chinensis TaxID=74649 RepID=A0A2P6PJ59_ROSCH|nr:hypothetical protein RchiOBHm_Chr6g0244961 [Rosa chinensis]
MDLWHVAHSLRKPSARFQAFHLLKHSKCSVPNDSSTSPNNQLSDPIASAHVSASIDRQYSIGLYSACCRLLHNVVKHHKREGFFHGEVEGFKCACFLRRTYEERRHQKEVFGPRCYHFLAYCKRVYSGYGAPKTGIKR